MSPRPDLGLWPHLGYAASRIERAAEKRTDADALRALEADLAARWYVVGGELVAMRKSITGCDPLFERREAESLGVATHSVFLGLMDGAPRFALAIEPAAIEALKTRDGFEVSDLRTIAVRGMVEEAHLPPLAEGKSLLIWNSRRRFCSNCGGETRVVEAGWRRDCPNCKMQHFPRTDPVVIMLAIDGDRCLLGRSGRFATNSWSCLAGFVEPGETIEEAVRREVREEAGVIVGEVKYFCSQPWPFPSSLMIGCHAKALSRELVVDHNELESARWFDREEVASMLARQHPEGLITPVPIAIAYHIIRSWVENGVEFT
ncbi:MAG: NAD(+) diphosphatase [Xanthobacteraceae bacterium]|nr:NAD(+) diphosphatase [Xanthobacteraceae bacterium]MBX9829852.1 NAD(+) diphosphatase [Xanthobacteraceae bacterium]